MALREGTIKLLQERYKDRFGKAMLSSAYVKGLTVVYDDGQPVITARVPGETKEHACYVDVDSYYCDCKDATIRKRPCKHVLQMLLLAEREEKIDELTLLALAIRTK